jgi:ribA/ribD-fused uncharacterized protein
MKKILEFHGKYRFLSNFWPAKVMFEGMEYPTSEHAFVAAKTTNIKVRRIIAAIASPAVAKAYGRELTLRPDWENVKGYMMYVIVKDKFTRHAELAQALLATGDAYIEEGNSWGDRVWGISPVGSGLGYTRLGKILMLVRSELQSELAAILSREEGRQ